jgi:hypothetical protein
MEQGGMGSSLIGVLQSGMTPCPPVAIPFHPGSGHARMAAQHWSHRHCPITSRFQPAALIAVIRSM